MLLAGRFAQVISTGYARFLDFQRLEDQERSLERSQVLTETAGAAAHEINQPLMVLMGIAQILLYKIPSDDPNREDLEEINHAGGRIEMIVKKMQKVRQYVTKRYVGDVNIVDFDGAADEADGGEQEQG